MGVDCEPDGLLPCNDALQFAFGPMVGISCLVMEDVFALLRIAEHRGAYLCIEFHSS